MRAYCINVARNASVSLGTVPLAVYFPLSLSHSFEETNGAIKYSPPVAPTTYLSLTRLCRSDESGTAKVKRVVVPCCDWVRLGTQGSSQPSPIPSCSSGV